MTAGRAPGVVVGRMAVGTGGVGVEVDVRPPAGTVAAAVGVIAGVPVREATGDGPIVGVAVREATPVGLAVGELATVGSAVGAALG